MMPARWGKWLVVASLLLNVFLLGAIAAGAYRWVAKDPAAPAPARALRFAAQTLDAGQRQQFVDTLREARREVRPQLRAGREARRLVLERLAAPEFDRAAVKQALEQTRAADAAVRVHIEDSVLDFAQSLDPQQRQQFAQGLARSGPLRQQPLLQRLEP